MPPFARNARRRVVARVLPVEQGEAGRARPRHAHEGRAGPCAEARPARSRSAAPARSPGPRGRCALRASRRADRDRRRPSRANTSAVDSCHARVDQQHRRSRKLRHVDRRKAISRALAARRHGSAGTREHRFRGRARPPGHAPDRCATMTSAAAAPRAASDEPPPMPEATGSRLSRRIAAPDSTPAASRSARPRGPPDCPRPRANPPRTGRRPRAKSRPPARRSAGRRRCRRRRSSRSRAARRAICREHGGPG